MARDPVEIHTMHGSLASILARLKGFGARNLISIRYNGVGYFLPRTVSCSRELLLVITNNVIMTVRKGIFSKQQVTNGF